MADFVCYLGYVALILTGTGIGLLAVLVIASQGDPVALPKPPELELIDFEEWNDDE